MESPPTRKLLAVASEIGQRYHFARWAAFSPQDRRSSNQPLPWTTSLTDIWPVVLGLHRPLDIMLLSTLPFRFEVRCCVSYVLSVAPSFDGKPSRASQGAHFLRVLASVEVATIIRSGHPLGQLPSSDSAYQSASDRLHAPHSRQYIPFSRAFVSPCDNGLLPKIGVFL